MILRIRKSSDVPYSEVTPESIYASRREFIRTASAGAIGAAAALAIGPGAGDARLGAQAALTATRNAKFVAPEPPNTYQHITSYNNFYEFGLEKDDPARNAGRLTTRPWSVRVEGLVSKPASYAVEDLVDFKTLEERVYRFRCVEAWSMVIPWIGVPLSAVISKCSPLPSARFVEFTTLHRPNEMPGQRTSVLDWPYVEALRMDEAMHPLTFMVVGLYGKVLPNQNGAPLRIHIPWKYGFKSGKSIVRLRFTDRQPNTTWAMMAPEEYGFYANVNPTVDHPRWSQATERRLPGLFKSTKTLMFNGYPEVESLYSGMDLRRNY
jgi:sulfoxide reductase catalytic subunit YedY